MAKKAKKASPEIVEEGPLVLGGSGADFDAMMREYLGSGEIREGERVHILAKDWHHRLIYAGWEDMGVDYQSPWVTMVFTGCAAPPQEDLFG